MGWMAITRENELLTEGVHGRPVQIGEEGKLAFIAQEDFGNKVAIDLINGVVLINYDVLDVAPDGSGVRLDNPKLTFVITEDTNIAGEYQEMVSSSPDENGWVTNEFLPLIWRPIWFTRYTNGEPTKILGAQTTFQGRNIKKMIVLFSDGRIGID